MSKRQDPPVEWAVVASAHGMAEAEILLSSLRAADIPAWISRESAGVAIGLTVGLLGRIEVVVPIAYYEQALELLAGEMEFDPNAPQIEVPEEGYPMVEDMRTAHNNITDVPGIEVGHAQDMDALTGCTVVICYEGAVGGVDQRGGAPGTRETDLLRPLHMVQQVHAVLLTGGSAFGLDAAGGVMRWLEAEGVGVSFGGATVPIVPAAVLFDLDLGSSDARPDAAMGEDACHAASAEPAAQGCVGAGTGAAVGKMFGPDFATKSGMGTAAFDLGEGLIVGALFAVNALGDVVEDDGTIIAGARMPPDGDTFVNTLAMLASEPGRQILHMASGGNTVIGVVATNAALTKEEANKVAQMAHDGLARAVRPAHTMFDGDTIFALATGKMEGDVNLVGAYAAEATAEAIRNAVHSAASMDGLPAGADITGAG
jgi:L-aminopeptidase/D-esterase-like protein